MPLTSSDAGARSSSACSLFTVSSLLGGLAQNGGSLIAARAVQGVGGAILAPATLSLITTTFTDPSARRRALGAWSATAASGSAVGVLAGGLLTDLLDWRWVLFVNVPIGGALVAAALVALTESRAEQRPGLDIAGAVTVTGGLALLVYAIVSTDTRPWGSAATIGTLAGAAALLALFAAIESRTANPLVPLGIFRRRAVAAANGIAVTIGAALFGLFFFLSLYLQQVQSYSPLKTGLAFLPAALSTMVGAIVGTRIVTVLGPRRQLVIGPVMAAGGLAWLQPDLRGRRVLLERVRTIAAVRHRARPVVRADDHRSDIRRPDASAGLASGLRTPPARWAVPSAWRRWPLSRLRHPHRPAATTALSGSAPPRWGSVPCWRWCCPQRAPPPASASLTCRRRHRRRALAASG